MKSYIVTVGTRKTGRGISAGLLKNGNKVRVICHHLDNAKKLNDKGAAEKFYEFTRPIYSGQVRSLYTLNAGNTTPTSIEEFAMNFKKLYDPK